MHKLFMQINSEAPSEIEHHGKPALLRGKQVSRGQGERVTSVWVDMEALRIRSSCRQFSASLPLPLSSAWHLPMPPPEQHLLLCSLLSRDFRNHSHASCQQNVQSRDGTVTWHCFSLSSSSPPLSSSHFPPSPDDGKNCSTCSLPLYNLIYLSQLFYVRGGLHLLLFLQLRI